MKEQSATPNLGAGQRIKFNSGEPESPVLAITNAAVPHSEDMRHRMKQYALTMGIRMVCLALIFVVDGWFKIIPVVGAVVLPWVAVIIANGGADITKQESVELLDAAPLYALDGQEKVMDDDDASTPAFLTGEIVPESEDTAGLVTDAAESDAPSAEKDLP